MARTRTTKGVAQRIDLNYFKRPTPFKRAKLWLAIVAPVIALVWIGWHFLGRDQRVYSSGQLSEAHAVLEKQCVACHVQQAGEFSAKAEDAACLACHDGPAHHPEATASNAPKLACASCHAEHRGRVDLAAVNSRNCASCHANLSVAGPGSDFAKRIESFANGHPEFSVLRATGSVAPTDPGTVKLNHVLHMKAIRRGPNGPMVQLDCSDCHRPERTAETTWRFSDAAYFRVEPPAPLQALRSYEAKDEFRVLSTHGLVAPRARSGREFMAPPKFETACAGCHSLTFDKRIDEGVPHETPIVIHEFLVKRFAKYIASHPEELRQVQEPNRNLAGRDNSSESRALTATKWIEEQVSVSEELLWHKTCAQCHQISGSQLQDVRKARWNADLSKTAASVPAKVGLLELPVPEGLLPSVANAKLTLQWLPHSRFDHDAHTGFSCVSCHQNSLKSTESSDLLIPGIAVCQTCHAPGPGYAEARCSECHTYHDWSKRKEVKPTFTLPALQTGGK